MPDMSGMTSLVLLDLSDNQFTGSLTVAWAYSSNLAYFPVQTNRLANFQSATWLRGIQVSSLPCSAKQQPQHIGASPALHT